MIIVPVWVEEELAEGYRAKLGSEPSKDAATEWIPKECVKSCTYAADVVEKPSMALLILVEEKIPEQIRTAIGMRK